MAPPTNGRRDGAASALVLALPNQVLFPAMRGSVEIPSRTFQEIRQHLEKTHATEIGVVALRPPKRGVAAVPYDIGTICRLVSHTGEDGGEEGSGAVKLQLEGRKRFRILSFSQTSPVRVAKVEFIEEAESEEQSVAVQALVHSVQEKLSDIFKQQQDKHKLGPGKRNFKLPSSATQLANMVGAMMVQLSIEERQRILETVDLQQRMELVMDLLQREAEAQKMMGDINASMQKAREVEIRRAILQRQMQEVQRNLQELREKVDKSGEDGLKEENEEEEGEEKDEITRLGERIAKAGLTEEAKRIAKKELRRLKSIQPQHPEYTISHTYLETLLSLPWKISSKDRFDLAHARTVLDGDHRGLEKVKKRILEFLAVQKMRGDMQGPILCLHGPPGIGKTSLGKSIAKSLDRKFHRLSLGGVRDEAELRGHRRTYIGSMPGNIMQALQTLKVNNPVILLDEVDKMSQNQMFNPQATLLEILDPEQNDSFKDHYVNTPFDLSKVLFICTANDTSLIDRALLDRMEVIELSGYTVEEKLGIAQTHLLPKQRRLHALEPELPSNDEADSASLPSAAIVEEPRLWVDAEAIRCLVTKWTAESGVRTLERRLAQICRWAALRLQGVETLRDTGGEKDLEKEAAFESAGPDENGRITIHADHLPHIVGVELFEPDIAERLTVGVAMGLSVSAVGGQLLFIEATRTHGRGKLTITGQLGKVMLESVETAMSLLRSRFVQIGDSIAPVLGEGKSLSPLLPSFRSEATEGRDPFKDEDIHVHFPAGGIPKDGPSAGVAVLLALASLLLGQAMRSDTAVTGEVSLRGHVLPVGGIRDKILAAHRGGVRHVLVPLANKRHVLEDVPAKTLQGIEIHYLKHIDEALKWAFPTGPWQSTTASDEAEVWAATSNPSTLPPGVPAAVAAAIADSSGTVFLPPRARL